MTIDEFINVIRKKLPPAPMDRLEAFEKGIGSKLPDDYRDFLIRCNGGSSGEYFFEEQTADDDQEELEGSDVCGIGGFRDESWWSLEDKRLQYQSPDEIVIPLELIWIMDDSFGNGICIGVSSPHRGKIYFWEHDREPAHDEWDGTVETAENITLIANSFTEFVACLVHEDDIEDEDEED